MAIAYVQGVAATVDTSPDAFTFGSNVTAGNTIVVLIIHSYLGCPVSISDSTGNSYTKNGTEPQPTTGIGYFFYVFTATANATGPLTITATFGCGSSRCGFAMEFSGMASSPYDGEGIANNTSNSAVGPSLTTTAAGDLILTVCIGPTATAWTAGARQTSLLDCTASGNNDLCESTPTTAAGSYAATASTFGVSSSYKAYLFSAAFKAALASPLVQDVVNTASSGTTVAATFGASNTAGNTLVVCCFASAISVTDSQGNTYTQTPYGGIWYSLNCLGGANTVTATWATAPGWQTIVAAEYTKASSGGGLDQNGYNSSTSASPTSAAVTTTVANELLVSYVTGGGSPTAGAGQTLIDNSTGDGTEFGVAGAAGSVTATMALATSVTWYYLLATFKPFSSGSSYSQSLSDSFTLADGFAKQLGRHLAEAFTLADAVSRQPVKRVSDAFTIADAISRQPHKSAVDSFSLAETCARATARGLAEAFTLAESFGIAKTKVLAFLESFSISESVAKLTARPFFESMSIEDALSKMPARGFAESLSVSESIGRAIARTFSNGVTLVETFAKSTQRQFVEAAFSLTERFVSTLIADLGVNGVKFAVELRTRLWAVLAAVRGWFAEEAPSRQWSATTEMIYCDPKDPESVEDFQLDWTAALVSDTITGSTWELPSDLTAVAQSNTTTAATVRLSGGTAGQSYVIKNVVTLASGRVLAQPLLLPVAV